jgi:hypothetical protein
MHISQASFDDDFKPEINWGHNKTEDGIWGNMRSKTKQDAIDDGLSQYYEDKFFVGCAVAPSLHVVGADEVIDQMICSAYDECGDLADELFEGVSKEAKDELDFEIAQLVGKWMTKHKLWPASRVIIDAEEIRATT